MADCQIEFCLASIDPNGQPTNGIVRVQTDQDQFGMNNDIHNSAAGGSDDSQMKTTLTFGSATWKWSTRRRNTPVMDWR